MKATIYEILEMIRCGREFIHNEDTFKMFKKGDIAPINTLTKFDYGVSTYKIIPTKMESYTILYECRGEHEGKVYWKHTFNIDLGKLMTVLDTVMLSELKKLRDSSGPIDLDYYSRGLRYGKRTNSMNLWN